MGMAGGDSAVGGALDFQEWCHLFSLQPLHLTRSFFGFHQHPQMLKLHMSLLMDITIFNGKCVTLPVWQRNHFNYWGGVSRKLWGVYLSLYHKCFLSHSSGFTLVRGKWSLPAGNKLMECLWNENSSCCTSPIPVLFLLWVIYYCCHALLKRVFHRGKCLMK